MTGHDRRLGAETARTLQDLQAVRANLFCEYLFLGSPLPPPDELPEPTAGALALLHKYWQDRRRRLPSVSPAANRIRNRPLLSRILSHDPCQIRRTHPDQADSGVN